MSTEQETAARFPPPLARSTINADGLRVPIMEAPFVECGQRARLGGTLVECIRRAGHPVRINHGHTNGFMHWAFDATEDADAELVERTRDRSEEEDPYYDYKSYHMGGKYPVDPNTREAGA